MDVGRANGQRTIAVCILGQDSASLSVIDTSSGAIETTTTTASRDCVALSVWLNASFGLDGSQPEALYLIGSRSQLAAIADKLDATVSVPVVATHDAQLALARGAATSTMWHVDHCGGVDRSGFASQARTLTAVAARRSRLAVHVVVCRQPGHSGAAKLSRSPHRLPPPNPLNSRPLLHRPHRPRCSLRHRHRRLSRCPSTAAARDDPPNRQRCRRPSRSHRRCNTFPTCSRSNTSPTRRPHWRPAQSPPDPRYRTSRPQLLSPGLRRPAVS